MTQNTFQLPPLLNQLFAGQELSSEDTSAAFTALLSGEMTPAQIAGFLVALRIKGETPTEVTAAAGVMRKLVTPVNLPTGMEVVDLCGTGGDGAHTFNISTASMFVLAAAGVKVAKHGGRSVSSSSGSADALEALGANINLQPAQVAQSIVQTGLGFMFAPNHHSAMRFAGPVRKELGVRTIFNVLGPLTNPAGATQQVMGVYSKGLLRLQAEVLKRLGSTKAMIVHGENGMDELCVECDSHVAELRDGEIREYTLSPESLGLKRSSHEDLKAKSVEESKAKILAALQGQAGAVTDIVVLNAGAGIYAANRTATLRQGVDLARDVILRGLATRKLQEFVEFTQTISQN